MIHSINFAARARRAPFSLERGFTAVAAHELRTPLAGLRAQAQIAVSATSPAELAEALALVMSGVDRASHLLDQLLDLARMETTASEAERLRKSVDVTHLYETVVGDLGNLASRRGLRLEADRRAAHRGDGARHAAAAAQPAGQRDPLHAGGRAGGDQHAPRGRRDRPDRRRLRPGIPVESRARVFERFERLDARGGDGVGLGMAIVQSVVVAHRAIIRLLESPLAACACRCASPLQKPDPSLPVFFMGA